MNNLPVNNHSQRLQELIKKVGISSLKELSEVSGLSEWQIRRVESGLLPKMSVETLIKLSHSLQVSVDNLLNIFVPLSPFSQDLIIPKSDSTEVHSFQVEYQRLQEKLASLESNLQEQWQNSSLDILESWLIYWPTAIAAVENNPALPAQNIIPLVKPVQQLTESWGLQAIASVGQEIPYNPQVHQLIEGLAQEGDLVKVRNVGYRKGEKLHLKVKVSLIS